MNETEKKKLRKKVLQINKIFISLLLIIVGIYIIYTIYLLLKDPTETFTVEKGTVYSEEITTGYIIRDETVLKGNNYKNGMLQIASEGSRVAKGETVFRYYSNYENNLNEKIAELDEKIQKALENENNSSSSDVKILEKQIDEKVKKIENISDISKIAEYKKEINQLVNKKAKIAGELSSAGSYIKNLIDERSKYEQKLNSGSEYITAPKSGIISYMVDGLENKLTTTDFSVYNKEYLESLNLKTGKIVASSDEEGKIIDNFKCYLIAISNSENAKQAEVGNTVTVRLSSNTEITAKITAINEEDNGSRLLVLELEKLTDELINYRKISFELIWWSYSGIKIPNQAIVEQDGLNYVVRNRSGYLNKLLIKVLRVTDDYSIVGTYTTEELKELGFSVSEISSYRKIIMYDEILVNPDLEKVE